MNFSDKLICVEINLYEDVGKDLWFPQYFEMQDVEQRKKTAIIMGETNREV